MDPFPGTVPRKKDSRGQRAQSRRVGGGSRRSYSRARWCRRRCLVRCLRGGAGSIIRGRGRAAARGNGCLSRTFAVGVPVGSAVPDPTLPAPTPHGSLEGPRSSRLSTSLCLVARAALRGAPRPRVGTESGHFAALLPPVRASAEGIFPSHPGAVRVRDWVPGCGAGGGEKARRKRERCGESTEERPPPRGSPAGAVEPWASQGQGCGRSWASWPGRRGGTEPPRRRGTRQRRAEPSPTPPGSSYRCRRGPGHHRGRGRRRGEELLLPVRATGSRSGARARAALYTPEFNGRRCRGSPRVLSRGRGGGTLPSAPSALADLSGPRPCPRGPGARCGHRNGSGPEEAYAAAANPISAPFDPKSSPRPPDLRSLRSYSCYELLGAQRVPAGQSARLPPRFSLCRGFPRLRAL